MNSLIIVFIASVACTQAPQPLSSIIKVNFDQKTITPDCKELSFAQLTLKARGISYEQESDTRWIRIHAQEQYQIHCKEQN